MPIFNVAEFTSRLRYLMAEKFPREPDSEKKKKHKDREYHMVEVAFEHNLTFFEGTEIATFEIGNELAEAKYPYYHILQDNQIIRKKGRASETTKGTQGSVFPIGKRDYAKVKFNGRTFVKEYSAVISRARREEYDRASRRGADGKMSNPEALSYVNTHYHYIDNILNAIIPIIASEFGLRTGRTSHSGLIEEFAYQEGMVDSLSYESAREVIESDRMREMISSFRR